MRNRLNPKVLLEILNEIAISATSELPYGEMLSHTLQIVSEKLDVESGVMFAYDEVDKKFRLAAYYGMDLDRAREVEQRRSRALSGGGGTSAEIYRSGKPFFILDMSADPRFSDYSYRYPNLELRSFANIPCRSSTKMPLTIAFVTKVNQQFQPEDIPILEAVAYQIGLLLEKSLLVKESKNCEWQTNLLYEISSQINASLDINQILEALANGVARLLDADIGFVGLPDKSRKALEIHAVSNQDEYHLRGLQIPIQTNEIVEAQPLIFSYNLDDPDSTSARETWVNLDSISHHGFNHFLGYPISRARRPIGLVCAANRGSHKFEEIHAPLISRLSQQVSTAIENAFLHQQVKSMAILEERNRLAAEMHDNLAQSISAAKMLSAQTVTYLDQDKISQARNILTGVQEILDSAYTDVREVIFSLSSFANIHISFLEALSEFLHAYETHYGIRTNLAIDQKAIPDIQGNLSVQIDRIIKEALSNSRRHSQATKVNVTITRNDSYLEILIEDNGIGFSTKQIMKDHSNQRGIEIMKERAYSLHGDLTITSSPGSGTRVELKIPTHAQKEAFLL